MRAELAHGPRLRIAFCPAALLMLHADLAGVRVHHRRGKRTTLGVAVTDLVQLNSTPSGSNRLWVTDIATHSTHEGNPFCCVVLDTFSCLVVG